MSLFNVCTWWSTQCPDLDNNYDVFSLLCSRFGLLENEKDYIVVGSQGGHLSIFYPNPDWEKSDISRGYRATDLLFETRFNNPVLSIYAGKFSSNNRSGNTKQLAILHPNSLLIYDLHTVDGVAEHGTQASLNLLVEHRFERAAFALCTGHFGQVKGREFFCLVHLDGTLTFYEQDGISYECQFPGLQPLPGPVVYCERTDSFIRFGATWTLECYTYQDLSHSSINRSDYQPVWSVCLGEGILDLTVMQVKESSASIMILGEKNFICLNDTGKLEFVLKLDYCPQCFFSFVIGYYWEPNARLITAIISKSSKIYIYEDANLIWAAQMQHEVPVALKRSNLNGLPGGIVVLGETGQLLIGYLGSEPFTFMVPPSEAHKINFQQAYKELVQLEEEIKDSVDLGDREAINKCAVEDVKIIFKINQKITRDFDALLLDMPAEVAVKELPMCKGSLKVKTKIALAEMQVTFNMSSGIRCSQETITHIDIDAGTSIELDLDFFIAEILHPHTARVDVVISFINMQGIPRVIRCSKYLPLEMFFKPRMPQRTSSIKLTFSIDSKSLVPKLSTFFSEFVNNDFDGQALGLSLLCPVDENAEEVVTIVLAKNSNRIRVQSDKLEIMPLILERLIYTAVSHNNRNSEIGMFSQCKVKEAKTSLSLSFKANAIIPSQDILHQMDLHREIQENIRRQTMLMDDLWKQFKSLQRKMQEKFEDEPKESLVMQIEQNYDCLISEGDKLIEMRNAERRQGCDLSSAISVVKMIITCLPMEEKIANIISSVLYSPIEDWTELSWEESMLPGIDMLHHYGPLNRSRNNEFNTVTDSNIQNQDFFDYNRFRKHFNTLFDRIMRIASTESRILSDESETQSDAKKTLGPNQVFEIANRISEEHANRFKNKPQERKGISLEAVEDDEDEYDEEDRRKADNSGENNKEEKLESSEWVNETFELPSSEELFNDLGIWW